MSEPAQVSSSVANVPLPVPPPLQDKSAVRKQALFGRLKSSFQTPNGQIVADPVSPVATPTPVQSQPEPSAQEVPDVAVSSPQPEPVQTDVVPSVLDTVAPAVLEESTDTLNPPFAVGSGVKEAKDPFVTVEKPALDTVPGVQYVEQEVQHELPPEVEAFVTKVEDHHDQLPQEVVIADQSTPSASTKFLAQPVIVLPITPEIEREGRNKDPLFSIRWLVEWSHKIMKMFSGRVIYRQQSSQ